VDYSSVTTNIVLPTTDRTREELKRVPDLKSVLNSHAFERGRMRQWERYFSTAKRK